MVAQAAKVSLATASYALRGDPKIPAPTRERVTAAAKRLGYHPDPELGRLMFLLRGHGPRRNRATVAVLTVGRVDTYHPGFHRRLLDGLRDRGSDLGYDLDPMAVDPAKMPGPRLTQILLHRGVRGVVLASLAAETDCANLFNWSRFPAIAATPEGRNLPVSRVVPHHFQNAELALASLHSAGRRRVGWVANGPLQQGPNALYRAVKTMAEQIGASARIPMLAYADIPALAAWLDRHRPDTVLVTAAQLACDIEQAAAQLGIATPSIHLLEHSGHEHWSGIDQRPEIVGKVAMDLLAQLIQSGQCGADGGSTVTMIDGRWNSGTIPAMVTSAATGIYALASGCAARGLKPAEISVPA